MRGSTVLYINASKCWPPGDFFCCSAVRNEGRNSLRRAMDKTDRCSSEDRDPQVEDIRGVAGVCVCVCMHTHMRTYARRCVYLA